jgi:hypothetical protein
MSRRIRQSLALVGAAAALGVPATAGAYPVIGDDPAEPAAQAQGHQWWAARQSKLATRVKQTGKPLKLCPDKKVKKACVKR